MEDVLMRNEKMEQEKEANMKRLLMILLVLILVACSAGQTRLAVVANTYDFESGYGALYPNTLTGTIAIVSPFSATGLHSVKNTITGGTNGYSRVVLDGSWANGTNIYYAGYFFLDPTFYANLQGESCIMRWDNYTSYLSNGDIGGLCINPTTKLAFVKRGVYTQAQDILISNITIMTGVWHYIQIHQLLSGTSNGVTEMWLDGALVGSAYRQSTNGRVVNDMRWGIVSIDGGKQTLPLTMWIDDVCMSTSPCSSIPITPTPTVQVPTLTPTPTRVPTITPAPVYNIYLNGTPFYCAKPCTITIP